MILQFIDSNRTFKFPALGFQTLGEIDISMIDFCCDREAICPRLYFRTQAQFYQFGGQMNGAENEQWHRFGETVEIHYDLVQIILCHRSQITPIKQHTIRDVTSIRC